MCLSNHCWATQDLKLKYYDLMIQFALHQTAYLDVAKHYYKIWETPSIKEDEEKGRQVCTLSCSPQQHQFTLFVQALEYIVYYVVLAPHDNEQSDMVNHLYIDPALVKLEMH